MTFRITVDLRLEADSLAEALQSAATVVEYTDEGGNFHHVQGCGMPTGTVKCEEMA